MRQPSKCRRLPQKSARREFQRIRNEKRACVDDGVLPGLIGKREVITDLRGATAVSHLVDSGAGFGVLWVASF